VDHSTNARRAIHLVPSHERASAHHPKPVRSAPLIGADQTEEERTMRVDAQGLVASDALVEVVQTFFDRHEPVAIACMHLPLFGSEVKPWKGVKCSAWRKDARGVSW